MERRESNRYSMFKAVISHFEVNAPELETFPALKESFVEFKGKVGNIDKINAVHQTVAKGATSEKNSLKDALVDELDIMCSSLYSFSKKIKDMNTFEIVDVTRSEIVNLKGNFLKDKANIVIDIIDKNASALGGYDITPEKIANLKTLKDSFVTSLDGKDQKVNTAVVARVDLTKEFDEAEEILVDDLDNLIKQRKKSNPDFYNGYIQARNIKDLGGGHSDSGDNDPPKDPPAA